MSVRIQDDVTVLRKRFGGWQVEFQTKKLSVDFFGKEQKANVMCILPQGKKRASRIE